MVTPLCEAERGGGEYMRTEDYAPFGRMILLKLQPKEKALPRFAWLRLYLLYSLAVKLAVV
jgi:hypothetical protein